MDPKTRVPNTLTVLQPGEHEICCIKRHPIGIVSVYAMCALIAVVIAALVFGLGPSVSSTADSRQVMIVEALVFIIVTAVCAVFALISNKIYWGNTWTLTTDSLTQVDQLGLFRRQSSQLSLENLEDVTSEQNGLLPRMFNYGLLRVETAGESSKFMFPFCPNPNYYASQILSAREVFEQHTHGEDTSYRQPEPSRQAAPPIAPPVVPAAPPVPVPADPSPAPQIDSYEVPGGPDGSV